MPVETPWQQLLQYVTSRVPDLFEHVQGATEQEIERVLMCCTRPVPFSVVELFRTMGSWSTIFWPFGRNVTINVAAMLEDPDSYPEYQMLEDRFFRIALALCADGIDEPDIYVDLNYSNGYDAPLTELGTLWDGREPHITGHTLMSFAIMNAFQQFDIGSWGQRGHSGAWPESGYLAHLVAAETFPEYVESMRALASRMDLRSVFCPRDDLQCYCGDTMSLMFDAIGSGIEVGVRPGTPPPDPRRFVKVSLGVADLDTLRNVGEQIRAWMPPLSSFKQCRADTKPVDLDRLPRP